MESRLNLAGPSSTSVSPAGTSSMAAAAVAAQNFEVLKNEVKDLLMVSKFGVEFRRVEVELTDINGSCNYKECGYQSWGEFLFAIRDILFVGHYPHEDPGCPRTRLFLFLNWQKITANADQVDVALLVQGQRDGKIQMRDDGTTNQPFMQELKMCDPIAMKNRRTSSLYTTLSTTSRATPALLDQHQRAAFLNSFPGLLRPSGCEDDKDGIAKKYSISVIPWNSKNPITTTASSSSTTAVTTAIPTPTTSSMVTTSAAVPNVPLRVANGTGGTTSSAIMKSRTTPLSGPASLLTEKDIEEFRQLQKLKAAEAKAANTTKPISKPFVIDDVMFQEILAEAEALTLMDLNLPPVKLSKS